MIDTKLFYKFGIGCFSVVALCAVANFFIFYRTLNFFSIISSLANIIFDFVLVGFFYYLIKTQTSNLPEDTPEDLEEALKEFRK